MCGPQQRPKKKKEKGTDTDIIGVIHRKGNAFAFEIIHVLRDWFATAFGRKHELELPGARCQVVRCTILIAERVAADDDGLDPPGDGSRNTLEDDWLAEDGTAEDVADLGTREKATSGRRQRGRMRNGGKGEPEGKPVYRSEYVRCHWENATSAST